MRPTRCSPFNYGGCLAAPGLCPWCLGDVNVDPASRMEQFLDQSEWQDHVEEHISSLTDCEALVCPHPRTQCRGMFELVQKFELHSQDVHGWIPKRP